LATTTAHTGSFDESTLRVLIRNDFVDAGVCAALLACLVAMAVLGIRSSLARAKPQPLGYSRNSHQYEPFQQHNDN
jgi:hypothetical protein